MAVYELQHQQKRLIIVSVQQIVGQEYGYHNVDCGRSIDTIYGRGGG